MNKGNKLSQKYLEKNSCAKWGTLELWNWKDVERRSERWILFYWSLLKNLLDSIEESTEMLKRIGKKQTQV